MDDDDCSLFSADVDESSLPVVTTVAAPRAPEKPLSDLVVDLDHIQPSSHPAKVIMDDANGLKVMLHFALDRPRNDVSVIVMVTTNQSSERVSKFVMDASVTKVSTIVCVVYFFYVVTSANVVYRA